MYFDAAVLFVVNWPYCGAKLLWKDEQFAYPSTNTLNLTNFIWLSDYFTVTITNKGLLALLMY